MASENIQNGMQGGAKELNNLEKSLQAYMQKAGADFANTIQSFNSSAAQQTGQTVYTPPAQQASDVGASQNTNSPATQSLANANPATMNDFIRRMQEMNKQYS